MDRRKFLVSSGLVGVGFLGAGPVAPDMLQGARPDSEANSEHTLEEKPVAFTVPPLPYSFDALEPYIDAKTMEIHHDKHHGAYVTNLNKALEGHPDLQAKSIDDLLKDLDCRSGEHPWRGAEQRRRTLEPLAVLAIDEERRGRRAERRFGFGH